MKKYTDSERDIIAKNGLRCYDCNLKYSDPAWIEAVVPNEIWEKINPTYHKGSGILCIQCIARRCVEAELVNVEIQLTAGPLICKDKYEGFKRFFSLKKHLE